MPADTPTPDEVWTLLTHVVMDSRDQWKRAVTERTGLPFSRIRVLRRLRPGPMTVKELAHAAAIDAPAATVTVNHLEGLGLVAREIDPANRRQKQVSITPAGRAVLDTAFATPDPAPASVTALSNEDLRALQEILEKLQH
ncbi:MarR family winged helix-turn-helix transcriptional regulator [Nocardia sp. 2YAB30]|uniref:MarR family winged helix-turn-helix transcriptional regulator n=1 Tax=unclassified Nocardia TaxID=2637762 RepID=UPI003F9E6A8D